MRLVKEYSFGKVRGWEFGWSPVGAPLMTVLSYRAGSTLIDTGQSHMRREALEIVKKEKIGAVLLTHCHEDHSGNARAIKAAFDIPVYAGRLTAEKLSRPSRILPYQRLIWGPSEPVTLQALTDEGFEAAGLRFIPIHTPGHAKGHLVYLVPEEGWLFSGDLYLSDRIKYFRADERIDEQIVSLKKVLTLDFDALFCAHHPKPTNGKAFISRKLQSLEDFYGRTAELARKGLDSAAIMKELHLREVWKIKLLCFGNVSMENMVRSTLRSMTTGSASADKDIDRNG
jgi:glyoxylase-like metal-dependent hydrolase (beta-lactamase superfamily II)